MVWPTVIDASQGTAFWIKNSVKKTASLLNSQGVKEKREERTV
jgi:hypothetical protein